MSEPPALRLSRSAELALLFVGAPLVLLAAGRRVHPILVAVVVAAVVTWLLLRDRELDRGLLWRSAALRTSWKPLLLSFAATVVLLTAGVAWLDPEKLFWLPRHRPGLWALVMVAYPVFSVYPQEIIYRAFFFHRYRPLFGQGRAMVLASAVAFGFMHVLFRNWIAVGLTLAGGLVFAHRYRQSRSLLVTSLEHALFGQWVFTVGLGEYFFAGTMRLFTSVPP